MAWKAVEAAYPISILFPPVHQDPTGYLLGIQEVLTHKLSHSPR